jgi:hypothetical protein
VPSLCQGRIVWVPIADRNGHNRYHRPFIILTPNEHIADSEQLIGVVGSNTAALLNPRPPFCIDLRYHPTGMVETRLRKPTVAICGWIAQVAKADIEPHNIGGIVPPSIIESILDLRGTIPPEAFH